MPRPKQEEDKIERNVENEMTFLNTAPNKKKLLQEDESEREQIKEVVHFESILEEDKKVFGQHSICSLEDESRKKLNIFDRIDDLKYKELRSVQKINNYQKPLTPKYGHFDDLIKGSNGIILRGKSFKCNPKPLISP